MRWLPAVLLAVAACAPAPVPPAQPAPPPWPADIDVERLHTIGDLPPAASTVLVAIARDGTWSIDGAAKDPAQLRATLKARAWPPESSHAPSALSATNVLVAADREAPWSSVRTVLESAAMAAEPRVFFAVRPVSGDEPGAVAAFLPIDRASEVPTEVRIRFRADEGARRPAQLLGGFREAIARQTGRGIAFTLDPEDGTTAGIVLSTCDVLWLAGARRLEFASPKDRAPAALGRPELVSADRVRASEVPADLPDVPRVRGAFAGSFSLSR